MSSRLTSWLCQPFTLPTAFAFKITVAGTPYTVTGGGSSTVYYRQYLARPAGTSGGTATDPHEFGAYIKGRINAGVGTSDADVRMRTDGRWEITTAGGTWSLLWDGTSSTDKIARDALGYSGNIGSTAANTYSAAAYVPAYALAGICRANSQGWQPTMQAAGAKLPDGSRYEFNTGYVELSQQADWRFFPLNTTQATTLGEKHSPVEAGVDRWKQPSSVALGASTWSAWTVNDFLFTCGGYELGFASGTFQDLVAGSTALYDAVYLDPASRKADNWVTIQANYDARRDVKAIRLDWFGQESRT